MSTTSKLSADTMERIAQWREASRPEPAVYFVKCGEFIKIGWSESWYSRIQRMKVDNPDHIEVLLVIGRPKIFEKTMHRKFAELRHRGEWFRDHLDIREYVEERKHECWHRAGRRK
jgi:hypothetical protein